MWLASAASSIVSRFSMRVAGLSVVAHSCSGIISPRPYSMVIEPQTYLSCEEPVLSISQSAHLEPLQGVAAWCTTRQRRAQLGVVVAVCGLSLSRCDLLTAVK